MLRCAIDYSVLETVRTHILSGFLPSLAFPFAGGDGVDIALDERS